MPDFTKNYNLKKPLSAEDYDIAVFNENSDIIDENLQNIDQKVATGDSNTLKTANAYTDTKVAEVPIFDDSEIRLEIATAKAQAIETASLDATTKADSAEGNAKSASTPIAHLTDGVVHITGAERSSWDAKETTAGAQAKADSAEGVAKGYTDVKISEVNQVVGGKAVVKTFNAKIPLSWGENVPYSQVVAVAGVLETDNPVADIVLSDGVEVAELEAWGLVGKIETGEGDITLVCYEDKPTVAFNVQLKAVR